MGLFDLVKFIKLQMEEKKGGSKGTVFVIK